MNKAERAKYDIQISKYKQMNFTSSDDVKKLILRDLRYKKMQFLNAELLDLLDRGENDSDQN